MIERKITLGIKEKFGSGKAIILLGARQTGKTTLFRNLFQNINQQDILWLNGDDADVQAMFQHPSSTQLKAVIGNKKFIVIDEAQRIQDIGIKLKLITDQIKGVQVLATGSSAFELANKINEPLTGRKWEYQLFPLSFSEMVAHHGLMEEKRLLQHRMLFGYYPEIVTNPGNEKELLRNLSDSFLYKDILMWERINKPEKLIRLLKALAFQIGNQVSINELSKMVELDNKSVEKYLILLEQVFVIFHLGSFSRNLRNELKHSRKYYFYDNGIRNALIANFQPLENRIDIGALWENFMVSERIKHIQYTRLWANRYFWRTHAQQEIDYIEETDGHLFAYEFKWSPKAKLKFPKSFKDAYPDSTYELIHSENFEGFLGV